MKKPALFIGSSTEGEDFARAVRSLLKKDAEVTVWSEGPFTIGATFIESLESALARFDFAAIVLTPDDLVTVRDVAVFGPRDNAVFELGLFMGRLGKSRTFVVRPSGNALKLPSDLAGLKAAVYDWPREDGNYRAAVGAACDSIREVIRKLGFIETRLTQDVRAVQDEQDRQRAEIDRIIRFLIENFVTKYELTHLKKLGGGESFTFTRSDSFETELRRLVSLGLIERKPERGFRSLFRDNDDVNNHMVITNRGREYLDYVRQIAQTPSGGSDAG